MEKSKPPAVARRVYGDSLSVVYQQEVYYPHAGEYVDFKGRPSVGLYVDLMSMASNTKGMERLASTIVGWNWTDDEGRPYENPPTFETLMLLPTEELKWLLQKAGSDEGAQDPNGITPSTAS